MDNPAPKGMELRLAGVPMTVSALAIKSALAKVQFRNLQYDFDVILEKSSEEVFWDYFDDSKKDSKNTARIIMPDTADNNNPGTALIDSTIAIECRGLKKGTTIKFDCQVTKVMDPETPNHRYQKLRGLKPFVDQVEEIQDGRIGYVSKVSCGNFDKENKFETTYTWDYGGDRRFKELDYFGDVSPRKFRVCLTESRPEEQLKWEWMDILESNIRGVVFQQPIDPDHGVVYFVLEKPPQFYERIIAAPADPPARIIPIGVLPDTLQQATTHVHSRITHPSSIVQEQDDNINVCQVPWVIQYSRVWKVEYGNIQTFNLRSYDPRLTVGQRAAAFFFEYLVILNSIRTVDEMVETIKQNMASLQELPSCFVFPGIRLSILRLLYNCFIAATSEEVSQFIDRLLTVSPVLSTNQRRLYIESINRISQDMETDGIRSLRRLYSTLPVQERGLKQIPDEKLVEPVDALQNYFTSEHWRTEKQRWAEQSSPGVFEVLVHPSHVELNGPVDPSTNSVMDSYRKYIDWFLRMKFVDNSTATLKVEAGVNLDRIIAQRVFQVLKNDRQPLRPIKERYEFLGYSMSSLKKRKAVWFFRCPRYTRFLDASLIRNGIGEWNIDKNPKLAQDPSKWGARVSLAFTESIDVAELNKDNWTSRNDSGPVGLNKDFPNTDGCGLISLELCKAINDALVSMGYARSQAFQIRFGGVKGVVYAAPSSLLTHEGKSWQMLLRKSQLKFAVHDTTVLKMRIVSTASDGHQSLFFDSVLKAFEDSGANTGEIERIYKESYDHLTTLSSTGLNLLRDIFRILYDERETGMKARYGLLKLALVLKDDEIDPRNYSNSFLALYLTKLAERARDKDMFKIPIPGSYFVLGLTDDYQVLEEDEVFIRAHGKTITGEVLVYRDPIIHIGDIQKATAVTEQEVMARMSRTSEDAAQRLDALKRMDNIIFFSQKDLPPFPNRLSGGDLDGDRFEILTKDCGFWQACYEPSDYVNYSADGPAPPANAGNPDPNLALVGTPFDIERVARFIGDYIRNDCFDELQDILMCLADKKRDGMKDPDVQALAPWLSLAVDYAKSGKAVDLVKDVVKQRKFEVKDKPDFLRRKPLLDPTGNFYQSPKLLGRIYRKIESMEYAHPKVIDNSSLAAKISTVWELELPKYSTFIDLQYAGEKLGDNIINVVIEETERYREYIDMQYLSENSEVDLFLRRQQDDFPNIFILDLMNRILGAMAYRGIVNVIRGSSRLVTVSIIGANSFDTVQGVFKVCLYMAW